MNSERIVLINPFHFCLPDTKMNIDMGIGKKYTIINDYFHCNEHVLNMMCRSKISFDLNNETYNLLVTVFYNLITNKYTGKQKSWHSLRSSEIDSAHVNGEKVKLQYTNGKQFDVTDAFHAECFFIDEVNTYFKSKVNQWTHKALANIFQSLLKERLLQKYKVV